MVKELYFPKANLALDDVHLSTGVNRYELADISYAEVVTRRYPLSWWSFFQTESLLFLGFAAIWAVTNYIGWTNIAGPILAIYWLMVLIRHIRAYAKTAYKHTLTLQTTSGAIEIAMSDDDDALLEACEAINRRIKKGVKHTQQESGEPTRWIQAK